MSELWRKSLGDSETFETALRKAEAIADAREREKAIAAWAWDVFGELEAAKTEIAGEGHAYWNRLMDQCDGAQVPNKGDGRPRPKRNITRQFIEEQKPVFADVGINIEVHPRQPDDAAAAAVVQDHIDYAMEFVDAAAVDRRGTNWMLKLGTFALKTDWDAEAGGGIGGPRTIAVDPRKVYVPRGATSVAGSWAIAFLDQFETDQLVRRWPERKDEILAAARETLGENRRGVDQAFGTGGAAAAYRTQKVALELWYRDGAVEEEKAVDPKAAPAAGAAAAARPARGPKYPDGRVFLVVGDLVLRDRANPFGRGGPEPGHGEFPLVTAQNIDRHDTIFGRGDAEVLDPYQVELDALTTMIANWARVASANIFTMTKKTALVLSKINNLPFIVIKTPTPDAARAFEFKQPPPLPEHVYAREAQIVEAARQELGGGEIDVTATLKSKQPVGTMQIAQETVEKRPRAKIDNKNRAWAAWARQVIGLMRQNLPYARVARLSGGRSVRVDPAALKKVDVERFDIRIVPTGRTVYSRAIAYQIMADLDARGVLGAAESMRRRRLIAENSGIKGAVDLVAQDEADEQQAAAAASAAPPVAPGDEEMAAVAAAMGGAGRAAVPPPELMAPTALTTGGNNVL